MKAKSFLLPFLLFALLIFSMNSRCSATVVTFDDLSEDGTGSFIANGYQGLNWFSFIGRDAFLVGATFPPFQPSVSNGYYNGMVSASNVAFNASGAGCQIDARGTNFNFLSAYLTGAWNSNLNIEVQGFNGTNLLYDTTVVASASTPTLFTFNYQNISSLVFSSFGGQDAGFPPSDGLGGSNFVMDNFTFEFVPEPSPLLLATAGALLLCPLLKRKRITQNR